MERANAATPRDIALLTQRHAGSISSAPALSTQRASTRWTCSAFGRVLPCSQLYRLVAHSDQLAIEDRGETELRAMRSEPARAEAPRGRARPVRTAPPKRSARSGGHLARRLRELLLKLADLTRRQRDRACAVSSPS